MVFVHAFGAGLQEVEPTQDGVNRPAAGEVLDVFKRVHHARMGATEQDHQAVFGVKVKGLVVQQRIWMGAGWITEEGAAGVFKGVLSGNFPGNEDAVQDFRGLGSPDYACGCFGDGLSSCRIHADRAGGSVGIADEFLCQGGAVKKKPRLRGCFAGGL